MPADQRETCRVCGCNAEFDCGTRISPGGLFVVRRGHDCSRKAQEVIRDLTARLSAAESKLAKLERDGDATPVDRKWLIANGFDGTEDSLQLTKILPPVDSDAAIVTLEIQPPCKELDAFLGVPRPNDDWLYSLFQGLPHGDDQTRPDDHVLLTSINPKTRGDVRRLLAALGCPLNEDSPHAQ